MRFFAFAVSLALLIGITAMSAAQNDKMTPIEIPKQSGAIVLGTGRLPESTVDEAWHSQYGSKFARNVSIATLTPFLPPKGKGNGTAVIVAPGGGFRTLSMENEGWQVAEALAKKGIAAFVLKYRLNPTPADLPGFEASMRQMFSGAGRRPPTNSDPSQALAPQIADATAAFELIRSKSKKWNVDPQKVGMIGFSAGAMLTLSTTLYGKGVNPAFIGNIYGPITTVKVPADAPPLFVALAADDPLFANAGFGLIESWKAAKRPVEFHLFEQGGHGFGMYKKETTSTGWFEAFAAWLKMRGFISK